MAPEQPIRTGEQEGVADLSVGVPAQERPADEDTLLTAQPKQHVGRWAVGRQRGVCELGNEGGAGREELGQRDRLRTRARRFAASDSHVARLAGTSASATSS